MDIANDASGKTDYLDYILNQVPKDLAALATLRDELARRQGALTAVDDANQLRADAEKIRKLAESELANAKTEAATILDEARAAEAKAKTATTAAKAREDAVNKAEIALDEAAKAEAKNLDAREAACASKEAYLLKLDASLNDRADKLANDETSLAARVKALQDKVASLSA